MIFFFPFKNSSSDHSPYPTLEVISTLAGSQGVSGYLDGPETSAQFNYPFGIAFDPSDGNILVADYSNSVIRLINATSNMVSTLAGVAGNNGYMDGPASLAQFYFPTDVAVDHSNGNVIVADNYNSVIRLINVTSNTVSTLAGIAGTYGYLDGPVSLAQFNYPIGIAIDPSNQNVIVSDSSNNVIRLINVTSNTVSTLAGVAGTAGYLDGPASLAQFNSPYGIAIDHSNGNIIVADNYNSVIRLLNVTSNTVSTLSGVAGTYGYLDGPASLAQFNSPIGIAIDPSNGNIFVADNYNAVIRLINITSNMVSTFAGSAGNIGYLDGQLTIAQFNSPSGITVDTWNGNLLISDTNNNVIRYSENIC